MSAARTASERVRGLWALMLSNRPAPYIPIHIYIYIYIYIYIHSLSLFLQVYIRGTRRILSFRRPCVRASVHLTNRYAFIRSGWEESEWVRGDGIFNGRSRVRVWARGMRSVWFAETKAHGSGGEEKRKRVFGGSTTWWGGSGAGVRPDGARAGLKARLCCAMGARVRGKCGREREWEYTWNPLLGERKGERCARVYIITLI